ncbi:MAG TPA: hypothetical protein VGX48_17800 [Pyrinomonadaceae bacterium]|jgi:hypothetical protein|nr:hypothetical protein [Pyrinomonadaceae bacterium]
METDWLSVARFAYEAYAETTENKNFRGEEMPAFDELPPKIREAWVNAVRKACDVFGRAVTA